MALLSLKPRFNYDRPYPGQFVDGGINGRVLDDEEVRVVCAFERTRCTRPLTCLWMLTLIRLGLRTVAEAVR